MAFNFGISDFFFTINLAAQIWEKCFTRAHGAVEDVQYLQFGNEIQSLGQNLTRLNNIFEEQSRGPRWRGSAHGLGLEISDLTGDFRKTLEECDKLLNDRERFHRDRAGFVDNVRWWVGGTEAKVKTLRERVHFHSAKIIFITKPVELKLLFEIRDAVEGLGALWAAQWGQEQGPSPQRLPYVPLDLKSRFKDALRLNTPDSFQRLEDFPLKEGWDALVYHFEESTVNFKPGQYPNQRIPSETQYLNLLKCTWILQMIKGSSCFRETGPVSLWARCIKEAEESIVNEYKRIRLGQLIPPEDNAILRLNGTYFTIWVVDQDRPGVPMLTDEILLEEKILEIALPKPPGTRKPTLTIFRKSDNELHIVRTITDEQNPAFRDSNSYDMNTDLTRFIPLYAVPSDSAANNNVIFCNSQGQSERQYSLGSFNDVLQFQQAVLGYKVMFDRPSIDWSIYYRSFGFGRSEEVGSGRVQIWQAKPLPRIAPTVEVPSSPTSSSYLSHMQSQTSSLATTKWSMVASGNASEIRTHDGAGLALSLPELPVVVIYTTYEKKYTFLYLQLNKEVYINDRACACRDPSKACCRVVIESTKKLDFKRLSARHEAVEGLNTWDLARFRLPRHPAFPDLESPSNLKYISLKFPTVPDREAFQAKFNLIIGLRDLDLKEYQNNLAELKRRASSCARPTPSKP